MVVGCEPGDKLNRFAKTPWTTASEEWRAIDQRLPVDHLARRIARAVALLNLTPLFDSYLGVGKKALRPDLLLKLVLYERQNKQPSPARWARDVRDSDGVRWLLFGMQPCRAVLYDFRERIGPFLAGWNAQVLAAAMQESLLQADRASLDSSSVAALASRKELLNEERLHKRLAVIDKDLQVVEHGEQLPEGPAWRAETVDGLREQKRRYDHAAAILAQRLQANTERRSSKRKPTEKVLVSPSDPEAVLALDKFKVFRPLYNVVLLRDLDSPFILDHQVVAQNNDNGILAMMFEQTVDVLGRKVEVLLADSGFGALRDLQFCALHGITLYTPFQENDYSKKNGKKAQSNQHTKLPKSAFQWLPDAKTYRCPEGHLLEPSGTHEQQRSNYRVTLQLYTCPPEHCQNCARQADCTPTPAKGRTVSRMDGEELLDELRQRMASDEVKKLYRLRSQTVELSYADMKEHRALRRFHCRGLHRVNGEVGALVLSHNLREYDRLRTDAAAHEQPTTRVLQSA